MGRVKWLFAFWTCFLLSGFYAFAQAADVPVESLIQSILKLIGDWGGLGWVGKIAALIMIILSTMKVSFLQPYWDKLGEAKVWAAPILGLIAGVLSLGMDPGSTITWAGVLAYVTAGAGAIILHELLDSVKAIPGIGAIWVSVIDFIQIILRSPGPKESAIQASKK